MLLGNATSKQLAWTVLELRKDGEQLTPIFHFPFLSFINFGAATSCIIASINQKCTKIACNESISALELDTNQKEAAPKVCYLLIIHRKAAQHRKVYVPCFLPQEALTFR